MDPVANLEAQRALVSEANAIRDRWPEDGDPPASDVGRLQDIAEALVELVQALDEWRLRGGYDPYATGPSREELAATRLLMDTALALGGMSEACCVAGATHSGEDVLLFCERAADGLVPLGEVRPARDGYEQISQT